MGQNTLKSASLTGLQSTTPSSLAAIPSSLSSVSTTTTTTATAKHIHEMKDEKKKNSGAKHAVSKTTTWTKYFSNRENYLENQDSSLHFRSDSPLLNFILRLLY